MTGGSTPEIFDTGYRHTGTVSILCTLPYRVKNSEQASAIILIMIYEVKCYYTKLDQRQTKCIAVERNCKDNDERSTMKGIRSAERRLHCTRPACSYARRVMCCRARHALHEERTTFFQVTLGLRQR